MVVSCGLADKQHYYFVVVVGFGFYAEFEAVQESVLSVDVVPHDGKVCGLNEHIDRARFAHSDEDGRRDVVVVVDLEQMLVVVEYTCADDEPQHAEREDGPPCRLMMQQRLGRYIPAADKEIESDEEKGEDEQWPVGGYQFPKFTRFGSDDGVDKHHRGGSAVHYLVDYLYDVEYQNGRG